MTAPTHAERLRAAAGLLQNVTETPRLDAEILLAAALGLSRSALLARLGERADAPRFDAYVARRLGWEPLAYILGEWEFFSLAFHVEPPLLTPRPETEHLVEAVLDFIGARPSSILEIGTGTGCVAVAIARNAPAARVTATDIEPRALELAQRNAARHGVATRMDLRLGPLYEPLRSGNGSFDAICSNPPYVEEEAWAGLSPVIRFHEDPRALLAGADGLDVIRGIIAGARPRLRPGGLLALEIGMGQAGAVARLLEEARFGAIGFRKDLAGIDRVAYGCAPGAAESL